MNIIKNCLFNLLQNELLSKLEFIGFSTGYRLIERYTISGIRNDKYDIVNHTYSHIVSDLQVTKRFATL